MPSPSLVLLRTQSDARLVALAREGHERAFEAIVERYRRQLLRTCRRVLAEARAEDALSSGPGGGTGAELDDRSGSSRHSGSSSSGPGSGDEAAAEEPADEALESDSSGPGSGGEPEDG